MLSPSQIRSVVENYFEVIPSRSNEREIVILCGLCHDTSGNRGVNTTTGLTNCWRCGKGFTLKNYAKELGIELDIEEEVSGEIDDLDESLAELGETRNRTEIVTEVKLPSGFMPLTRDGRDGYHRMAAGMARRKKLTLEALVDAGAGVAPGNYRWEPYVIFPVWEWGRVVYYQGRTLIDPFEGETKQFPSRSELPRGSRYWIYGIDELRRTGGVAVLVESILNTLSLRIELAKRGLSEYVPICIFKHKLSKEQLAKLVRCRGVKEVSFLYDADATASADQEAAALVNKFPLVTVAEMPKGDANDDASLAVDRLLVRRPPEVLVL